MTSIPLVDIIINIDCFTSHFEDKQNLYNIFEELFDRCNNMKKLLLKHGKLILGVLMKKYDIKCKLMRRPSKRET